MSVLSFLVACFGAYLAYLNSSPETRNQAKETVRRLLGSAGRVVMAVLFIGVTVLSAVCIILFWNGEGPITRAEVVMLILHFINLAIYGALSLSIIMTALGKRSVAAGQAS
jgi:hypothetical protein